MKSIFIKILISFQKKVKEICLFQTIIQTHVTGNLIKSQGFKMKFIVGPLFQDFDV